MALRAGIVGLPNVGKTTLFNALTKSGAEVANYAFSTVEPNVGIVPVPDPRVDKLAQMAKSDKTIYSLMEFVDIAGLSKGASQGEGLGNKFLHHIREVDAIVHVVRCFEQNETPATPLDDIDIVDLELIYADIESLERQGERLAKQARGDKKLQPKMDALLRLKAGLETGKTIRALNLPPEDLAAAKDFFLLTGKPVLYCCNLAEGDASKGEEHPLAKQVAERAAAEGAKSAAIAAKVEAELTQLAPDERQMFMDDLGLTEPALDRVIRQAFHLLGLISFLTVGPKEARAWTIREGAKAPEAAGAIHSDLQRGFIRVEVTDFKDVVAHNGLEAAKKVGKMRLEGKDYVVRDGDVCLFRSGV
jgi:GTP-binding protein YchF